MGGQRHVLADLILEKRHGTQCTGGCMAAGHVWTIAENVALTRIRTRIPKRLARPTSLARSTKHKYRKLKCIHMKVMGVFWWLKLMFTVYSVLINLTQFSEVRVREGIVRLAKVVLSALCCCTCAFNERWTHCPELAA